MRILITAGGTGGHVYPALAVAQALGGSDGRQVTGDGTSAARHTPHATRLLWIGAAGGMEAEFVRRAGIEYTEVQGGGLHGMGWKALPNLLRLAVGFFQAVGIVRRFRPQALFVTGGFVAAPVALAAYCLSVPSLVYLPDIEPGLAVRGLSRLARRVAVTAENSRAFFEERKVVVTGYPVRTEMRQANRDRAREVFGLDPHLPTVTVYGGSRGARSLNRALLASLPELLEHCQVIHVSGRLDWPEVSAARERLPRAHRARYHAFAYLHDEMALALAAADLAVARAGASALGELPALGVPAILVPYPHAWQYQKVNADYLAERGAAVRLNDEDLTTRLVPLARHLLTDPARLARMREGMRALDRPGAAQAIAAELRQLASGRP